MIHMDNSRGHLFVGQVPDQNVEHDNGVAPAGNSRRHSVSRKDHSVFLDIIYRFFINVFTLVHAFHTGK